MKKRLVTYPLLLFLIGCGIFTFKEKNDDKTQFIPYLRSFIKDSNGKVDNFGILTMELSDLKHPKIGLCYPGINHIEIDRSYWNNASKIKRKALIYHELGHCILYRIMHTEGFRSDGCHSSIMAARITSKYCLKNNWKYYIKELFDDK